jgi:phosphatidylethanolamine-binding protein (PEBP) family uncharacterized protein
MSFKVTSSALDSEGFLPCWYSRTANNSSPPLGWANAPRGTVTIALICEEPARSGTICHWVLYNLPPEPPGIYGGLPVETDLENGAGQGVNSFGVPGWTGPEDTGELKQLDFTAYALNRRVDIPAGADPEMLRRAMNGAILASSRFTARYMKSL